MQLGMIGLGKMGSGMTRRLLSGGHDLVVFDRNPGAIGSATAVGAVGAASPEDLAARLAAPRAVWVMVPSGDPTEKTIADLAEVLEPGDTVIDGGNSNYKDTLRRAAGLSGKGLHAVDVGTSGGIWGVEEGYSMTVGGEPEVVERRAPGSGERRVGEEGRSRWAPDH